MDLEAELAALRERIRDVEMGDDLAWTNGRVAWLRAAERDLVRRMRAEESAVHGVGPVSPPTLPGESQTACTASAWGAGNG